MKTTKLMLIGIATFIATWLALSTFVWLCAEFLTFRDIATNPLIIMIMIAVGWVPTVVVVNDCNERYV
jgi:hypothetical protein